MNNIIKGLFAGLIAGLILALLYAVDYGPGANLHTAAKWIALDSRGAGDTDAVSAEEASLTLARFDNAQAATLTTRAD